MLGLPWTSVDLGAGTLSVAQTPKRRGWQHGCEDPAALRRTPPSNGLQA
jgi:hypothetical protein